MADQPTTTAPMRRGPTELERAEAASMQEQVERLFEVGRQIRKTLDDGMAFAASRPRMRRAIHVLH
jgi:hypothetical protein